MNYLNKFSFLFLIILAGSSCGKKSTSEESAGSESSDEWITMNETQIRNAGIQTGKISWREISGVLKVTGRLDVPPSNQVKVSPPIGGFLKNIQVLPGQHVHKGDLLGEIEDMEILSLQQEYLENKAQLVLLESEFNRQQTLRDENVNATKTFEQAHAAYESMKAKVAGLKSRLQFLRISIEKLDKGDIQHSIRLTSPVDGFVTKVGAATGAFVRPEDGIFELVDPSHIHAELTVFEQDVPKISIGKKVSFQVAGDTMNREAEVYLIGREVGEGRTINVHCHLFKEDAKLVPGTFISAQIETFSDSSWAVPLSALAGPKGNRVLYLSHGGKFKPVSVKEDGHSDGFVRVILGEEVDLNSAEIVTEGAYQVYSFVNNKEEE